MGWIIRGPRYSTEEPLLSVIDIAERGNELDGEGGTCLGIRSAMLSVVPDL